VYTLHCTLNIWRHQHNKTAKARQKEISSHSKQKTRH
jgi:hypothetical protein